MRSVSALVIAFLVLTSLCMAQQEADRGGLAAGTFGSAGKQGSGGVFLGIYDTGSIRKLVNPGFFINLGLAGPTPQTPVDGLFSFDFQSTYNLYKSKYKPAGKSGFFFLNGGYSRLFATGNAADYGCGLIWRISSKDPEFKDIRFEYREQYLAGKGRVPGFRISYELGATEF